MAAIPHFFDLIHCVSLELSEFLESGKTNSFIAHEKKLQRTSVLQTLTTITNLASLLPVQLQEICCLFKRSYLSTLNI